MKSTTKKLMQSLLLVACCATAAGVTTYVVNNSKDELSMDSASVNYSSPYAYTASGSSASPTGQPVDLTYAAEKAIHAVVHIKSTVNSKVQTVQQMPDVFEYIFGDRQPYERQYRTQPQVGYGSGVILSSDGYIVTNNHVIDGADVIDVTLNDNRTFQASVIGSDPNTDLALIKIEGDEFPIVPMGNSDALKLGEWVLAVGNPFNLTSTVTAGVVSAKARKIGIYDKKESIESFIQTDAAINMGNSGGALVNSKGELVGINAALESPTGTYAGYGFAIPTTIVGKVVADLKEYGAVQRALLGILGSDVTAMRQLDENKDRDFGTLEGVYVSEVPDGGGALAAGLKKGDIITKINGKNIKTMTELQETIAQYRPGDKVSVSVLRDKKNKTIEVTLKNSKGNTDIVKDADIDILGAAFKDVSDQLKKQLNIGYGLQVSGIDNGIFSKSGIKRGYIILKVNSRQIKSESDLRDVFKEALSSPEQVLFITGIYPSGLRANYAVDLANN
jgi:Do/DeqQ family serine protease